MTSAPLAPDLPPGFSIEREEGTAIPTLRLIGEMDLRAATELREALVVALADGEGSVALELGELTFLDSTIISVLIMAKKRAETTSGEVRLLKLPRRIQRILAITGIESLFVIEPAENGDGSEG
ncbi:MAG: STAS domain-containing protein [Acidimicrobiales bacterium]